MKNFIWQILVFRCLKLIESSWVLKLPIFCEESPSRKKEFMFDKENSSKDYQCMDSFTICLQSAGWFKSSASWEGNIKWRKYMKAFIG